MKYGFFLILFVIQILGHNCYSQDSELKSKLKGLDNLDQIMSIVDEHYNNTKDKSYLPKEKHWNRWAMYMSQRTKSNGQLTNISAKIEKVLSKERKNRGRNLKSSTGQWHSIGPLAILQGDSLNSAVGIGRVDRIAFHPTDPNIFYIGTPAGGLFKTITRGASWTPVTDYLPSIGISGIVVCHNNPDDIYIMTGDGDSFTGGFIVNFGYLRNSSGVYKSTDGGTTWFALSHPTTDTVPYYGFQLKQDPNDASVLFAATNQGIFRSTNSGLSWTQVDTSRTYELEFKPNDSNTIYATQPGRFIRSTDGGNSFDSVIVSPAFIQNSRIALAVTPLQPDNVYLAGGSWGADTTKFGGIYTSTDSGVSFVQTNDSPNIASPNCNGIGGRDQTLYDWALGVSPDSSGIMLAGAVRMWRSIDSGNTFMNASSGCGNSSSTGTIHADIHDIEYHPLTGEVFVCNDGGLVKSTDHGQTWISLSKSIIASQVYNMALSPSNDDVLMIGLQDNGIKLRKTSSTSWHHELGGDGYSCVFSANSDSSGYLSMNKGVFKFDSTVTRIVPDSIFDEWFPNVTTSIADPDLVLAGFDTIYRSTDGGTSWSFTGGNGNWSLEASQSNSNRYYAIGGAEAITSSNGAMYRSDDTGLTWDTLSPPFPSDVKWTDIGIRPNNSNHVWVTIGGFNDGQKVYFSDDAGVKWTNRSAGLPNIPILCIAADNNNNVYAGTDIGVYYMDVQKNQWVPFWHNFPNVPVTDIALAQSANTVYAATFGRGVWKSDMYSTCIDEYTTQEDLFGNIYVEVADSINASHIILNRANSSILFKAGERVRLNPGFHAKRHTRFRAHISPCGESN